MRAGQAQRGGTGESRGGGAGGALVQALVIAGALAACIWPGTALAGSYRVVACDAAPGAASDAWRPRADHRLAAAASCPTRGDQRRGLVVRNEVNVGRVRPGARAALTFAAPAGAALRRIDLDWDGHRASGDWTLGLRGGDGRLLAGCPSSRQHSSAGCRLGDPAGERGFSIRLGHQRSVSLLARCDAREGCSTAALDRGRDRTRVRLAMHRAVVAVADGSAPNLSADGALVARGWQRGWRAARISAADNVGIRSTSLRIHGVTQDTDRQACDHTRPVPCPRRAHTTHGLLTSRLPDGRHLLTLTAADTAGNERRTRRLLKVDNHAPTRVRDIHLVGRDAVRRRNSFDVRWTPPGDQVAPIVAARYRLCRRDAPADCVVRTRAGAVAGIEDLRVPSRGEWELRVWLVDAAGNADRASASAPVLLRFDDRAPSRLDAALATGAGETGERATVTFGARPRVVGSLSSGGAALANASLRVRSRVRGTERFQLVGLTRTDASGRFDYRLPRGPSRTIRVTYGGDERHRPVADGVHLAVRAKSTLEVNRHRVRNGGRVRFTGTLLGGHVPDGGKLIQLEAFYRDRWRTFAVERTDATGAWRRGYRFEATPERITYPFRVRIPKERDYPYAVGYSRVVRVTVNGG